jgi:hypothetical protein
MSVLLGQQLVSSLPDQSEAKPNTTHGITLLLESIQERAQKLVGIVYLLCILSNNPDQRRLCLGFIQLVQICTQRRDDSLVAVRVFPEDIL